MSPRALKVVKLLDRYRIPGGASFTVGEVVGLAPEDADELIKAGRAVPYQETPKVHDTAITEPIEAAVMESAAVKKVAK